MIPADVLDHQADLMTRLENPMVRRAWGHQLSVDSRSALTRQAGVTRSEPGFDRWVDEQARGNAAASIAALRESVAEAESFYVTRDMAQMIIYAASQLEELDRIDRKIAPTRCGLARFEGGLPFGDVRGRQMRVSWIAWGPATGTTRSRHDQGEPMEFTAMWLWNDQREEPDEIALNMAREFGPQRSENIGRVLGRWGMIGNEFLSDGQRLGPAWARVPEEKMAEILADGDVPTDYTNPVRLIHAFWLLLGQTVIDVSEAHLARPYRKRAMKAKLPPRVTVIQLRNIATRRQPGESQVEWSHRWPVRGFWRWQVCGPNHPLAQELAPGKWRARIWIAPFVKGPAGKPLVVSRKVYSLSR